MPGPFEARSLSKYSLNPQDLVPFGHALAAGERPYLELSGVGRHRQVADECIFGLAGAPADHRQPPCLLGKSNSVQRLCYRTDLVELDQHSVGDSFFYTFLDALQAGSKQVIADELNLVAKGRLDSSPACP